MSHRLAAGLEGFEKVVIAPSAPGSARFDRDSGLRVVRAPAGERPGAARTGMLNAAALAQALALKPALTLSAHIVASPAAAAVRGALGARTVQYFHAEEIGARPRLAAFAARHADLSIAVSAYTAGLIAATGGDEQSIRLIPPGVDLPDDPAALASERPTIVTVARIEERYKGHDMMVRALALVRARVPQVRWIVIGDGSLRAALEGLVRSYGLADAVRFEGAVSDEQRDRWLRRADVLAMPSRLPAGGLAGEGFGIVYMEAAAFGKPVVAGRAGGALDAVVDGETGLLVDADDPIAVADALARLLQDRELASSLGRAGAQRAREFAWPRIVQRVQAVLEEALQAP
jgi:phosphatidylinositol alpha-1,6-mannosyltransferase